LIIATNIWLWVGFIAFVLAMLALDLGVFHRKAHEVKPREAALWTALWVAMALAFAAGLHAFRGGASSVAFLAGYVLEESLSADNIFVIVLIFTYFGVPRPTQHRVLFYGILGALILRGLFIGLGAALLARFHWILYVFGALLLITGGRMALQDEAKEFDGEKNLVVRLVQRLVPLTPRYHGLRFFTVENGRRLATPLFLVVVLVEFTDLLFAIDSIPAVFGVTRDPFIVFTSNIFAVLGLRSLFFLMAAVVDRFHLLRYGLAVVLSFIGAKMLADRWIDVPTPVSLLVIVLVLGASVAASLRWPARPASAAGD
jgi:tellurite resistance protein TerC